MNVDIRTDVNEKFDEFTKGEVGEAVVKNPETPQEVIETDATVDEKVYQSLDVDQKVIEEPGKSSEGELGVDPGLVVPTGDAVETPLTKEAEKAMPDTAVIIVDADALNSQKDGDATITENLEVNDGVEVGGAPDSSELEKAIESFYTPDEEKVNELETPTTEVKLDGEKQEATGKDPEDVVKFEEIEAEGAPNEEGEAVIKESDPLDNGETIGEDNFVGNESEDLNNNDGSLSAETDKLLNELGKVDEIEVVEAEDFEVGEAYAKKADILGVTSAIDAGIAGNENLGYNGSSRGIGMESHLNNVFSGMSGMESATSNEGTFDQSGAILDSILKGF